MVRFSFKHWRAGLWLGCIALTAIAWQQTKNISNQPVNRQDTLPSRNPIPSDSQRELDKVMRQLDEAVHQLDNKIKNMDWQSLEKQIQFSMKKAQRQIEQHGQDMQRKIQESMKNIDAGLMAKEVKRTIEQAQSNIDIDKMQAVIERSVPRTIKYLNGEEFRKNFEQSQAVGREQIEKAFERAAHALGISDREINGNTDHGKSKGNLGR